MKKSILKLLIIITGKKSNNFNNNPYLFFEFQDHTTFKNKYLAKF